MRRVAHHIYIYMSLCIHCLGGRGGLPTAKRIPAGVRRLDGRQQEAAALDGVGPHIKRKHRSISLRLRLHHSEPNSLGEEKEEGEARRNPRRRRSSSSSRNFSHHHHQNQKDVATIDETTPTRRPHSTRSLAPSPITVHANKTTEGGHRWSGDTDSRMQCLRCVGGGRWMEKRRF